MTAQRAMYELRQCRFTYAVTGKGTFVHPESRTVAVLLRAMRHPTVTRDVAEHLRRHQNVVAAEIDTVGKRLRRRTSCELLAHAIDHQPLLEFVQRLWPDPPDPEQPVLRPW